MLRYTFTTNLLPPTANHQWRSAALGGTVRTYLAPQARQWREYMQAAFSAFMRKNKIRKITTGNVSLTITFAVKRDRDIDGGLKPLLDALQGVYYENDRQVNELVIYKVKANQPCLYLTIKQ